MIAIIKSKEQLLLQLKEPGFTQNYEGDHIIGEYGKSMHQQVFQDGGKVIYDYTDGMDYRSHHLNDWMVIFELTDELKKDLLILPAL